MNSTTPDKFEYIAIVARQFCRDHWVEDPDLDEMAESTAIELFTKQYPKLFTKYKSKLKSYLAASHIRKTLTIYGLDYKKFYFLFLFITDYTNLSFSQINTFEEKSPRELANDILADLQTTNSIEIKTNNHKFQTKNHLFIESLKKAMTSIITMDDSLLDCVVRKKTTRDIKKYRIARMKFFTTMMKYFLDVKLPQNVPSKVSFIGHFLYLAELCFEREYWLGYKPKPIGSCKPFELKQYEKVTIDGKEMLAVPFNVGKHISDTIKKCQIEPNVTNSLYFYVVDC